MSFRELLRAAKSKIKRSGAEQPTLPLELSHADLGGTPLQLPATSAIAESPPALLVTLHRARGLSGAPVGSRPVCSVACGREKYKTFEAAGPGAASAPKWDQNLTFGRCLDGTLLLKVKVSGSTSGDEKACVGTLRLDSGRSYPRAWHALAAGGTGGGAGELELTVVVAGDGDGPPASEEGASSVFARRRSSSSRGGGGGGGGSPLNIDPDSPMSADAPAVLGGAFDTPVGSKGLVQNVRVGVRVRPPIATESRHPTVGWAWTQGRQQGMSELPLEKLEGLTGYEAAFAHESRGFEAKLDRVYGPDAGTADLYDSMCRPILLGSLTQLQLHQRHTSGAL